MTVDLGAAILALVSKERLDSSGPSEARVGQVLCGKWRVDRLIEIGGMSAVYEATHRNGRRAAIKVLEPRFAADQHIRRRFLREGYVANKIDHPGAVAILDDDVAEDGSPFLVMELLDGESLSQWLTRVGGKLPVLDVLAVAGQLLEVLDVAHEKGIVHRDIKPGNVFATKTGHAKLLDFGLARIRDGDLSGVPTAAGIVLGTGGYMAPEQASGVPEHVDARADLFAVGALVFRALAGRPVHDKGTPFETIIAAMEDRAPPFSVAVPGAPPLLAATMDRALAFDKEARWPNARAMSEAVRASYEEARRRPPPLPHRSSAQPRSQSEPDFESLSCVDLVDSPSLMVEVAFGDHHGEAIECERLRVREMAERMIDGGDAGEKI